MVIVLKILMYAEWRKNLLKIDSFVSAKGCKLYSSYFENRSACFELCIFKLNKLKHSLSILDPWEYFE